MTSTVADTAAPSTTDDASEPEEPFYWTVGTGFYHGKYPPFPDVSQYPGTKLLEDNYEAIKAEVLDYYERHGNSFKPNYIPYGYKILGWKTATLYSYFLQYPNVCKDFPFLDSIARQIPNMCLAQVAVLDPHTDVRAHLGETSGLVRSHLGVVVPAGLPEVGIRVGGEKRGWEEGKVWALTIAHRHRAWNHTDQPRIVVMIDVINPDFVDRKYEIAGRALSMIALKGLAFSFPTLLKTPEPVVKKAQTAVAWLFRGLLFIQRHTGLSPSGLLEHRPRGRRYDHPR